jgi:hypothetical protein
MICSECRSEAIPIEIRDGRIIYFCKQCRLEILLPIKPEDIEYDDIDCINSEGD